MSFTSGFSGPFFAGSALATATAPPGAVSLDGQVYLLDRQIGRHRHVSDPVQRPQQDTAERPGEATLAVAGAWRRSVSSWEHGAGQDFYDRDGGDPRRFRASRGVDCWDPWQISLLPSVSRAVTGRTPAVGLAPALTDDGPGLFVAWDDGMDVYTDAGTTICTTGQAYTALATDGYAVFTGGATGIVRHNIGGDPTSDAVFNANLTDPDVLAMAKGRLIGTTGPELWDVIDGAVAAATYTHPSVDWTWSAVAAGQRVIYAAGATGLRGAIYGFPIKDDATGLDVPVVVGELPDGETPLALAAYLGYLVIGTSLGVRLAQQDSSGYLTIGPLLETGPCRTLEPQGRFVWFGWEDAFADASGLGRLDLSQFTEALAPAYATDLMASVTGEVTSAVTHDDRRWFFVGPDVCQQVPDETVRTGWIESGWVTYGLGDDKALVAANVTHQPLPADASVLVEVRPYQASTWLSVGESSREASTGPVARFATPARLSSAYELRVTLLASTDDYSLPGPTVTRVEVSASPAPPRTSAIYVPLVIADQLTIGETSVERDPVAEKAALVSLASSQRAVPYSEGREAFIVTVSDYEWLPTHYGNNGWNGTIVLKLQRV